MDFVVCFLSLFDLIQSKIYQNINKLEWSEVSKVQRISWRMVLNLNLFIFSDLLLMQILLMRMVSWRMNQQILRVQVRVPFVKMENSDY